MTDILREINLKLKTILPVGVFCCACMVDINFDKKTLDIWLGGLPDCVLYKAKKQEVVLVKSTHLPLGVLSADRFKDDISVYHVDVGDRFYMWSDGIIESRNQDDEMFGFERLLNVFSTNCAVDSLFEKVKSEVYTFIGEMERDDDITMAEVQMVEMSELGAVELDYTAGTQVGPRDWIMDYLLGPDTLREYNPLPLLLHVLMDIPGLRPISGQVYTVMAELYSNALEHGVLGLKSSLKSDTAGFASYYLERTQRLKNLNEGHVRFKFEHKATEKNGTLVIRVEDSGQGFDYKSLVNNIPSNKAGYCGRGISLIKSIGHSIEYFGNGNIVEVRINW